MLLRLLLAFFVLQNVCGQDVEESVKNLPPLMKKEDTTQDLGQMWPYGIVSYSSDLMSFDVHLLHRLRRAMNVIEGESCLRFLPALDAAPDEKQPLVSRFYLNITANRDDRRCAHAVQHKPGGQIVVKVGYECVKQKQLLHTLLHGVGLADEIAHPHRNKYVRVLWENILPEFRHLFGVQHSTAASALVEYDPTSIMHFHDRAYSRNGEATIAPLLPGLIIQPSDNLSQLDKLKLRQLFGHECNKRKVSTLLKTCKNVLHKHEKMKNPGLFDKAHLDHVKCEGDKLQKQINETDGGNGNDNKKNSVGFGSPEGVSRDVHRSVPKHKPLKADYYTIDRLQTIKALPDYD